MHNKAGTATWLECQKAMGNPREFGQEFLKAFFPTTKLTSKQIKSLTKLGESYTADELRGKSAVAANMFVVCESVSKYVAFADAELRAEIESSPVSET